MFTCVVVSAPMDSRLSFCSALISTRLKTIVQKSLMYVIQNCDQNADQILCSTNIPTHKNTHKCTHRCGCWKAYSKPLHEPTQTRTAAPITPRLTCTSMNTATPPIMPQQPVLCVAPSTLCRTTHKSAPLLPPSNTSPRTQQQCCLH
jgi:hypothetical protein